MDDNKVLHQDCAQNLSILFQKCILSKFPLPPWIWIVVQSPLKVAVQLGTETLHLVFHQWNSQRCDQYLSLPVCPCFCLSVCDPCEFFWSMFLFKPDCFSTTSCWWRPTKEVLSNQPTVAPSSQFISVFLCLVCLLSVSPLPAPSICPSCVFRLARGRCGPDRAAMRDCGR